VQEREWFGSQKNTLSQKEERATESSQIKSVIAYVLERRNGDGGYAFSRGTESNAQDTYCALAILRLLKVPFPGVQQTARWLEGFDPYSLHSQYYMTKALELCAETLGQSLSDHWPHLHVSKTRFEAMDLHAGSSFWFNAIYMVTELMSTIDTEVDRKKTVRLLLSCSNDDGGFGVHSYSDLTSTYHALSSLHNLGFLIRSLKGVAEYVRSCEMLSGGFTLVPNTSPAHMEHAYHGVASLSLLEERPKYPQQIARFVFRCQRSNGGFARSEAGISTLEDTYYAIDTLRRLGRV